MRRASRVALIERLRHRLNLSDWEIRLADVAEEVDQASVQWRDMERVAEIRLAADLPRSMDEAAIAHEMVHLVMTDYAVLAERLLVFVKDEQARITLTEMLEDANERVVDTLAMALSTGPRFVAYGKMADLYPSFA